MTDSNDSRQTYRERRLAKAERLEEWAAKREDKAEAAHEQAHAIADMIPFGQPILAGHHSQRRHERDMARITGGMDKAAEHATKAREMQSRAENIKSAAERAVYSDDVDAVQRLQAKLEELEARRDSIKAYNASAKKGSPDPSLLISDRDRQSVTASHLRDFCCKPDGQLRVGVSNLAANINKTRKRIAELSR